MLEVSFEDLVSGIVLAPFGICRVSTFNFVHDLREDCVSTTSVDLSRVHEASSLQSIDAASDTSAGILRQSVQYLLELFLQELINQEPLL